MTMTKSDVYYDMYDRDIYASPYETFRRLRNEAPLSLHRGIVSRLFTPRAVAGLEPRIRALCEAIVDDLVERDQFDFMRTSDSRRASRPRGWEELPVAVP